MAVLTDDVQVSDLSFGRDRIYLTHISAPVFLLQVVYVQEPRAVFVVGHGDSRVSSDDVIVDREYGGLFEVHPGHLRTYCNIVECLKKKLPPGILSRRITK